MEKFSKYDVRDFVRFTLARLSLATEVTQKAVAEFVGIDTSNLSRIALGKYTPGLDTFLKIVQGYCALSDGFILEMFVDSHKLDLCSHHVDIAI